MPAFQLYLATSRKLTRWISINAFHMNSIKVRRFELCYICESRMIYFLIEHHFPNILILKTCFNISFSCHLSKLSASRAHIYQHITNNQNKATSLKQILVYNPKILYSAQCKLDSKLEKVLLYKRNKPHYIKYLSTHETVSWSA